MASQRATGEDSATLRQRVTAVRDRQYARSGQLNAHLEGAERDRVCRLSTHDAQFLEQALTRLGLSVRAWHRLLKVARTLADMEGVETIAQRHLAEALSYRAVDRLLQTLQRGNGPPPRIADGGEYMMKRRNYTGLMPSRGSPCQSDPSASRQTLAESRRSRNDE